MSTEPKIIERKADPGTGKVYKTIYIRTLRFNCLNKYHENYYRDNMKGISSNIESQLTPRGIAHWIMGDGLFILNDGVVVLCTESFKLEEVKRLVNVLTRKFGINSTLVKRVSKSGTTGWRIRVRKRSMDSLIKLVNPFIIPELRYKIGKS